ncbi:ATP-dependent RecD-like DNA helicase [Leifsonia sp. NPDC014704]|uniref:ATP-dependent DNA helicase n=1 Tax=Leifsonia sp. NPDC014704 TaxID=3364123 RepID=UPI0036F49A0E
MGSVDEQILSIGANIDANIALLAHDRALLAQNILSQLRNLVEAVAVRLHHKTGEIEFDYALTAPAVGWIGSASKNLNFLYRFHKLLQMSASHYTLEGEASERLMLAYYEYLIRTRDVLRQQCGISTLLNLELFPIDQDPALRVYHQKIAERVDAARANPTDPGPRTRYYIHKVRPFFTDGRIFYEVTFTSVSDRPNKFDRIIAFTDIDITDKYAANLALVSDAIEVLGRTMPITIIEDWEVSIRPCEFDNLAKVFGQTIKTNANSVEYRTLMRYLTETSGSLLDLMDASQGQYEHVKARVTARAQRQILFPLLDAARTLIRSGAPGTNVIRYLLLEMNNRIIKLQHEPQACARLSGLFLTYSAIPFDDMPYCTALLKHNPRFWDLVASIDPAGRDHELLARRVTNNVERHGMLYTPRSDLEVFGAVDHLIFEYNRRVYYRHPGRKLLQDMGQVFRRGYEDDTTEIVRTLQGLAHSGVEGYADAVDRWLNETPLKLDDDLKRAAMRSLFAHSQVAVIYGAAGTGKSTMVNYIANYFSDKRKLFLAHTNPAKANLERRVSAQNAEFRTITSQIYRRGSQPTYDVLVIDECSIVSNANLLKVLEKTSFKLLVLVGDVYQIESIEFGNWFGISRAFLPSESVFELTTPYRTKNPALLDLWTKVRHLEDGIEEAIARNGYSTSLDASLFEKTHDDEIVLCLNYDGLYGINNINRFLQSSNPSKGASWGVSTYKVGDPVLFNDTDRFGSVIFNNLKGRIVDVILHPDRIQFDVWLDTRVTSLDVDGADLRYVTDSTVSFDVYPPGSSDDDDEVNTTSVPFQVAYAVSIHKAQGLEYDSVKVVITDANEGDVTHNILYTAITRARAALKVFWSPETEHIVLSSLERSSNRKDVAILSARQHLTPTR